MAHYVSQHHRFNRHFFVASTLMLLGGCYQGGHRADSETIGDMTTVGSGNDIEPGSTAILSPEAIVIDQALADEVLVMRDHLRLPADGLAERGAALAPGSIIVGPPHSRLEESNGAGFLRRVESVKTVGDWLDVETSQATLEDVFQEADMNLEIASPEIVLLGDAKPNRSEPWLEIFTSPPVMLEGVIFDFSGTTLVDEAGVKIVVDKGYLHAKPSLDIKVKIGLFKLKYLFAQIAAPYDAGLAVSGKVDLKGAKHIEKKLVDDEKIAVVKFSVAGVPVVFVLRMTVDLACDLWAKGGAQVGAGVRYYGSPTVGVKYESKTWSWWDSLDFSHKEAAGADVFAEAHVECAAPRVRFDFRLYDVVGPFASIAPTLDAELSASFDSKTCDAATCSLSAVLTPGIELVVGFIVKVFGKSLVDASKTFPLTWPSWEVAWACEAGWLDQNCEPSPDVNEAGVLAMTPKCYIGSEIESISWADAECASAFGPEWHWLEFHKDGGWAAAGPWRDAIGVGERAWVTIDDQDAECFESSSGLTWLRASQESGATCWPGTGLDGPQFTPHVGACNPYNGDTPCSMCRRIICSAD